MSKPHCPRTLPCLNIQEMQQLQQRQQRQRQLENRLTAEQQAGQGLESQEQQQHTSDNGMPTIGGMLLPPHCHSQLQNTQDTPPSSQPTCTAAGAELQQPGSTDIKGQDRSGSGSGDKGDLNSTTQLGALPPTHFPSSHPAATRGLHGNAASNHWAKDSRVKVNRLLNLTHAYVNGHALEGVSASAAAGSGSETLGDHAPGGNINRFAGASAGVGASDAGAGNNSGGGPGDNSGGTGNSGAGAGGSAGGTGTSRGTAPLSSLSQPLPLSLSDLSNAQSAGAAQQQGRAGEQQAAQPTMSAHLPPLNGWRQKHNYL